MTGITTIRLPNGEYRHACTRSKDGRRPAEIGCRHLSPRSAIAHSANLDPYVSPLRSDEPPAPNTGSLSGWDQGGSFDGIAVTGHRQTRL